jgi:hypothetical protein
MMVLRDDTEDRVRTAKAILAKEPEKLREVQKLYQRSQTSVNLLVEDIQTSIRQGRNPEGSVYFSGRNKKAQADLTEFNSFVAKVTAPPGAEPKFLPALIPVVSMLSNLVTDRVQGYMNRKQEEKRAAYNEVAAELDVTKFKPFSEISERP